MPALAYITGMDHDIGQTFAEDLLCRGMTSFLYERKIRIFDYPKFAQAFRSRIARTRRSWRR
jgi:hypothetical protein